jgi:16S rRNA (cytosine967-C5)-methyltransferase
VLDAVRSGRYAEEALSEKLDAQCLSREDRALATELAYGVLRWRLRLDSMIARCLDSPKRKLHPRVREILRMAVYQLTLLDRIPDHAAVNEAVNQARSWFGERTAGFVNAVLRTTVRNLDALTTVPDENPQSLAVYYSHPVWLVKQWLDRFGPEGTRGILVHNNSRATLVIRVNRLKTDCDGLVRLLESRGISVTRTIPQPDALLIGSAGAPVRELPGFDEGLFAVQDAASQMVASLLGALPGDRILDACAAP